MWRLSCIFIFSELECPKPEDGMGEMTVTQGSDVAFCNPQEEGGFCNNRTEKCCSHGRGTSCVPKSSKFFNP